ncbi:hypothetical protein [Cerasicoccus frondis]|uniref:hypothetical protein n=1 Tax=Cerasicoccus frondis TaxID=490090 RepID=UPI002852A6FB|nr:hypothetical protein [Cerasicoccus frondis]
MAPVIAEVFGAPINIKSRKKIGRIRAQKRRLNSGENCGALGRAGKETVPVFSNGITRFKVMLRLHLIPFTHSFSIERRLFLMSPSGDSSSSKMDLSQSPMLKLW